MLFPPRKSTILNFVFRKLMFLIALPYRSYVASTVCSDHLFACVLIECSDRYGVIWGCSDAFKTRFVPNQQGILVTYLSHSP
ncbi:hypothetical protein L596_027213 [Steinernema carpocapsae]|uniref:Secreted protein n=1 Tax=Steinernema carpocapsae TaxID=34508 RepID=A0A4U5M4U1_STECR|nr:hypothetical protein L596_027213 [Steinernema carpocapsae]